MGQRTLTQDRVLQGFKSQDHLDAFYAYFDHSHGGCDECGSKPCGMWFDDGYQPGHYLCPEGKRLQAVLDTF